MNYSFSFPRLFQVQEGGVSLNIAHILLHSEVNGPFFRTVIWFQGCKKRCKGCFNPHLQPFIKNKIITIEELINIIIEANDEGITLSGGEPFEQKEPLSIFLKKVKEIKKSIVCYTGYTYEELLAENNPYINEMLKYIDLLIDGEYKQHTLPNLTYTGSGNQRLIWLNNEFKKQVLGKEANNLEENELVEFIIKENGEIEITGFPSNELLKTYK